MVMSLVHRGDAVRS